MFYSTEILSDKKYALSTVWRAGNTAPGARSTGLRRKAVFEVDVRRACGTIREPPAGAPIALRLQGTLLYGTARIFQEQCRFVLNDSERVQRALRKLCSSLDDQLDAGAGKTRPAHLVLPNDPSFDLDLLQLPAFDFDAPGGGCALLSQSRQSWTNLSLPSRASHGSQGSHGSHGSQQLVLDADSSGGRSFAGAGSAGSAGSFGRYSASNASVLPADQATPLGQRGLSAMPSFADEDNLLVDVGLFIDENGNIVEQEVTEEVQPQLPAFPSAWKGPTGDAAVEEDALVPVPMVLDDDGELVHPEEHLARDIKAAADKAVDPSLLFSPSTLAASSPRKTTTAAKQVGARPRHHHHKTNFVDEITQIPLSDYFRCVTHYADNMARAVEGRDRARAARRAHDAAAARQAAYDGTWGRGLFGVGRLVQDVQDVHHPLVQLFAGDALGETLYGEKLERAKRRKVDADVTSAAAAAASSAAAPSTPLGRQGPYGLDFDFDDDDELEIERGRQPGSALSDNPSLAALQRAPSSVGGGSVQQQQSGGGGTATNRGLASSAGGRSSPGFLERYSDDGSVFGGALDFGSVQGSLQGSVVQDDDDDDDVYMSGAMGTHHTQQTNSQLGEAMRDTTRFLELVQATAGAAGTAGAGEPSDDDGCWVAFDDVVAPFRGDRPAVVGAFMSLLTLATGRRLRVGEASEAEVGRLDRPILIGVVAAAGDKGVKGRKGRKAAAAAGRKRAFREMMAGSGRGSSVRGSSVRGSSVATAVSVGA